MEEIAAEARGRWPVTDVRIVHRLGRLEIGEASVAVAVVVAPPRRGLRGLPLRDRHAEGHGAHLEEGVLRGRRRVAGRAGLRAGPPGVEHHRHPARSVVNCRPAAGPGQRVSVRAPDSFNLERKREPEAPPPPPDRGTSPPRARAGSAAPPAGTAPRARRATTGALAAPAASTSGAGRTAITGGVMVSRDRATGPRAPVLPARTARQATRSRERASPESDGGVAVRADAQHQDVQRLGKQRRVARGGRGEIPASASMRCTARGGTGSRSSSASRTMPIVAVGMIGRHRPLVAEEHVHGGPGHVRRARARRS